MLAISSSISENTPTPIRLIREVDAKQPSHDWWRLIAALAMVLGAFAIRSPVFGNPLIAVDENFYLLVGDRMLHGALPYVDIWDRKPIGIFLLYAAIRLLGGSGIIQYQVVATLFAAGTGFFITRIASRIATPLAAIAAGLLYLLLLGVSGGSGGQTPVFYDLFVAAGARLTLSPIVDDAMSVARLRRQGMLTMLLLGVAMQVKYTVVFEGVFFGLVLVRELRRRGRSILGTALEALLLIGVAIAPTAIALGYFACRGEAHAFVYANFLSIFVRSTEPTSVLLHRLGIAWITLHLPLFCVILSAVLAPWRRLPKGMPTFGFVSAWIGAAILGYLIFGTYFNHYALPLFVPISIGCAPLFSYRPYRIGLVAACVMLTAGTVADEVSAHSIDRNRGGAKAMRAMVAAIRPRLTNCLYVFRGDSLLYYETNACIPTRYAFPEHLTLMREAPAIGVNPLVEIRRVFATRPSVVVDMREPHEVNLNPAAITLGRDLIARYYRLVSIIRTPTRAVLVYQRADSLMLPRHQVLSRLLHSPNRLL